MFSTAVRRATSVRSVATARRHLSTLGTLYTAPGTPNPDTVHLYLHEAGANDLVTMQKVNIGKGANRDEDYLKMNPMGEVPALALADNSMTITESVNICRYIDSMRTDGAGSPLTGEDAAQRAESEMWLARVEGKYLVPMYWTVRCGVLAKFFEKRTPGYIHPEIAAPMGIAAKTGLSWINAQLASDGRSYLCGDRFTIADIKLYTSYKFLSKTDKAQAASAEESPAFLEYIDRISAKESAKLTAARK